MPYHLYPQRELYRSRPIATDHPLTARVLMRTVHGTKSDACKERDRIKSELESGLSADGERMTFGEFALQ